MLETIAWAVLLMGLGAIIIVLVGVAIVWMCREDICNTKERITILGLISDPQDENLFTG